MKTKQISKFVVIAVIMFVVVLSVAKLANHSGVKSNTGTTDSSQTEDL
jgi:large-conductance mechanosensitive channel